MTKTSFAVAGLALAMAFGASAVQAQNKDNAAMVDPMMMMATPSVSASMPTITPAQLLQMMQDKTEDFVIVDTQPIDGYNQGHIPGAISFPWVTGQQIRKFPIALPRNKTLVLYDSCPVDGADVVNTLASFGYSNIKVVRGGWSKWVELQYPIAGRVPLPQGASY